MPKAILRNGVIYPVEPLPAEWSDGAQLSVEKVDEAPNRQNESPITGSEEIDRWEAELNALCAQNDATELAQLQDCLREMRLQAKEQVRRDMGLS